MKIAFHTLGCKVNQSDTDLMMGLFREVNYEIVEFSETADIYVINTCVVTNIGEKKSKQLIRQTIKRSPQAKIVVTGCYPQTNPTEVEKIIGVDLIIGNQDRHKIVELVESILPDSPIINHVDNIDNAHCFEDFGENGSLDRTRAFLKIQEGCNQYCSYCIIPYARGKLRSRSLESIQKATSNLVAKGFKEIVLLGIHLGAYGKDFAKDKNIDLSSAVKTVLNVEGVERLRLGSLESIEVSEELLEIMVSDARLCRHLHLPLQSGSDKILQAMNRPYTTTEYGSLVSKIRSKVPDITITTDIIVGFPNETVDDFTSTCKFLVDLSLDKVHVFPFSPRRNTPAEKMQHQISPPDKKLRTEILGRIDQCLQRNFFEKNLQQECDVLWEKNINGYWEGFSQNYIRVYLKSNENLKNKILRVRTEKILADGLLGKSIFK